MNKHAVSSDISLQFLLIKGLLIICHLWLSFVGSWSRGPSAMYSRDSTPGNVVGAVPGHLTKFQY